MERRRPKKEAANVLNLARHVGDEMDLFLDPACEFRTFADALYVGRACDEAGFFWYEDPMRDCGVSLAAHRRLREMIRTPLLITEHVRGFEPKAEWVASAATDFVRADPDMDMGITGTMRIAHLRKPSGWMSSCTVAARPIASAMSAIRNTNFYELALVGPKIANPVPPIYRCGYTDQLDGVDADGCYPVPDGIGLGVEYDWAFIEKNRTALHVFD